MEKKVATVISVSSSGSDSGSEDQASPATSQRASPWRRGPVVHRKRRTIYIAGRPPWYDSHGQMVEAFVIGLAGGSASGKTTVARRIIESLGVPWVSLLSMDSFYRVLTPEQHEMAAKNEYNFDHPDAFDYDLMAQTLCKLKEGKHVEIPVYDFNTHSRAKYTRTMYGANVIVFEGILAFTNRELLDVMDLKIFVDTDSDIRLARRLRRDIAERGRDLEGVLKLYNRYVKPSFQQYIEPTMQYADIVVPRGAQNEVAMQLIVQHVKDQLKKVLCAVNTQFVGTNPTSPSYFHVPTYTFLIFSTHHGLQRGFNFRSKLLTGQPNGDQLPNSVHILPDKPQVKGMHTVIRSKDTKRDDFVFFTNRLACLVIEYALSRLPFKDVTVNTPQGQTYAGKRFTGKLCGVSILRAGEVLEPGLMSVCKDATLGKILIQTNQTTGEPELHFLRLPPNIADCHVVLMDATVATGAAAIMAIRVLLVSWGTSSGSHHTIPLVDHDVPQERILFVSILAAQLGVQSVAYAFPCVRVVTSAMDRHVNDSYHILPGVGNYGDRYFGTGPE